MTQSNLQPFVYPFRGLLLDQYAQPTGVEFLYRHFSWLTPGVVATRLKQGHRGKSKYLLACKTGTRIVESARCPTYIGRGMIRLHEHEAVREDVLLDEQLETIDNPDRQFAGFEFADYIWDDGSLALVSARSVDSKIEVPHSYFAVHRDGTRSRDLISPASGSFGGSFRQPPAALGIISEDDEQRYYYPWLRGSPERLRGLTCIGWNRNHSAFVEKKGKLTIFDHELNEIAQFDGVQDAALTSNSRIVLHERTDGYPFLPVNRRVYGLDGHSIRSVPDDSNWILLDRARSARRGFNNSLPIRFHEGDFSEIFTLPSGHYQIQVSPDGLVFTSSSPTNSGGKGASRAFRCYSPEGKLIQSFSVKHPSEYAQEAASREVALRRDERRRRFLNPARIFVHTETLYAANAPDSKNGITYLPRRSAHGYETTPGVIYILPQQGGVSCCPVCGHACGLIRACMDGTADTDYARCRSCGLTLDVALNTCYDDRLDREFGGQFGTLRRDWLDRTGWLDEDLDRLEYVFQIDTSTWPRPEPDA